MIEATVVADSVSPAGKRLSSVQITAHRFILAEINTHRMFSRSYRSSRAVPSARLIEEVRTNPAMPVYWGANEKGMAASGELSDEETLGSLPGAKYSPKWAAQMKWHDAARNAARSAEDMASLGLHKQIANRVLEPFLWVHGIITATEWENFFGLRLHKMAQPEFRALANAIWPALKASTPRQLNPGDWHLPYIDPNMIMMAQAGGKATVDYAIKQSVARCARSSYNSFDTGKRSTIEEDLATYAKLNIPGTEHYDPTQPIHASPAEHQATPDIFAGISLGESDPVSGQRDFVDGGWKKPEEHGNFSGWRQFRKMLPGEAIAPLPKECR